MSDGVRRAGESNGPFGAVDPKLTVFALANGLDLAKEPSARRLEWFTEGLERGILVEAVPEGGFHVHALCWPTGSKEAGARTVVAQCATAEELVRTLSAAILAANGLRASR